MRSSDSWEPTLPGYKPPRLSRREMAVMAAVFIAGAIGLTWLSFHVTDPERAVAEEDRRRVSLVRSEAIAIFIPSAFDDLAKNRSEVASLQSHEDVKACLRRRGLEKAWYAIIYRVLQSDGKLVLMPVYCRPSEPTWKPWEFRAVLDTSQGRTVRYTIVDFTKAKVSIMAEELANTEPGVAITELIRRWEGLPARTPETPGTTNQPGL